MSDSESVSDNGKGDRSRGRSFGRDKDDQELDSTTINIQAKRFYVDVKQSWRGRYIKIAESMMGAPNSQPFNRRKSRIIISMTIAEDLVNVLQRCEDLGAKCAEGSVKIMEETLLHHEKLKDSDREYNCEYKENSRGRFLHIGMSTDSMTFGAVRQMRPVINVPATGLGLMREELSALLDKWGKNLPPDNRYKGPMPEQKSMRVGNKTYYFDYGQNKRGVFMRLSEVKPQWRTAITIPQEEWANIAQIFQEAAKIVDIDIKSTCK